MSKQPEAAPAADVNAAEVDLEKSLDASLADLEKSVGIEAAPAADAPVLEKSEAEIKAEAEALVKSQAEAKVKAEALAKSQADQKAEEDRIREAGERAEIEKSLAAGDSVGESIEVSKFLNGLVKSLSDAMGTQSHRISALEKSNAALIESNMAFQKAMAGNAGSQNEMLKSLGGQIGEFGGKPQPRKVAQAAPALEKSFRGDGEGKETDLSKSQIADRLSNLEIEGKVAIGTTSNFEANNEPLAKSLEDLVYAPEVAK